VIPLLVAAALPGLFWDQPPDTAAALKQAGVTRIFVPGARVMEWKAVAGVAVEAFDAAKAVKVDPPQVQMRVNQASASRSPWVDTNGASFARQPQALFYINTTGPASSLAAAEAHMFGVAAAIQADPAGLVPVGRMQAFLAGLPDVRFSVAANIGYIDDGSEESLELMKLMVRRNLLFRVVDKPDRRFDLTVRLGTPQYSKEDAMDPSSMAQKIRFQLTDQKRLLRIYGSEVVIGRLESDGKRARLYLLNYSATARPVNGIRVRASGRYTKQVVHSFDSPDLKIQEPVLESNATEFTLPEVKVYAVVDLSR
jgi:hypothetical protein